MIRVDRAVASYRSGFTRRRREVLSGVSFHVPKGAIAGYLGVNGAGKTTTIKLVVGINAPDSGEVTVAGLDARSRQARAKLGYLPENPYFYEYLTPREALDFYGRLSSVPAGERAKRAEALLADVDLLDAADRPVREFSKGMRQRLGLAQALVHNPEVLVLDEPLTGLDPMGRLALRDIIARQRAASRTVFFSSHVLSDVEAVCDHLVILDGGKVTYEGPVEKLLEAGSEAAVRVTFEATSAEPLAAIETAAGAKPEKRGDRYEVLAPDRAAGERALDAVRAGGARLVSFQPQTLTLEDYFLRTYGKKKEGAAT